MKRVDGKKKSAGTDTERPKGPARDGRSFRFCLTVLAILVGGLGGVAYWAWRELSLERSYQQQYGPDWQGEFEKCYGSVTHAHQQIAVCALGLFALAAIFAWNCFTIYRRRTRERFTYHSI